MATTQLNVARHMELFNPFTFETPITIIGAGATGSWLALALAKLGITDITVYDFDVVEEHNVPNQVYNLHDAYEKAPKTTALFAQILNATGTQIKVINGKFEHQRLAGIVFLMVDSMSERKRIWEECIKMKSAVSLLIEPRMGLDVGRVYNVTPTNLEHVRQYEDTYYSDDVAEVSACGASMTVITTALGVASWCARQLINFANGEELDNEILIDFKFNNLIATRW